ncbi:hypothetical protein [Streptomyces sp. ID01-9D]|uniref:hypothetical protein n=1 Tax=Streptomyces sp. ID01-9D TaxID=3028659 RepID=UPI0029C13A4A|nr:hypothetical protein [Streptomyces sp. ID01-9D]MDX5574868.1 hypothetical protein [Streptomyces sp. ID01-9D]
MTPTSFRWRPRPRRCPCSWNGSGETSANPAACPDRFQGLRILMFSSPAPTALPGDMLVPAEAALGAAVVFRRSASHGARP